MDSPSVPLKRNSIVLPLTALVRRARVAASSGILMRTVYSPLTLRPPCRRSAGGISTVLSVMSIQGTSVAVSGLVPSTRTLALTMGGVTVVRSHSGAPKKLQRWQVKAK